jgi:hypothetical protein
MNMAISNVDAGRVSDFLWFHYTGDEAIDTVLRRADLLFAVTINIFAWVPLIFAKPLACKLRNPVMFLLLWITTMELGVVIGMLLMYFPIPKFMTYGLEIGGVLPTSCAASIAYEGSGGMPCTLARFWEFLTRDDWQWNEMEGDWITLAIMATLAMIPPLCAVVVHVIDRFILRMSDREAMWRDTRGAWDPEVGDMKQHGAKTEKSDSLV